MYTREKKLAAVLLYIKYDCSPAAVLHELGYPDRKTLLKWYREYLLAPETSFTNGPNGWPLKYSAEQRQAAVKHYLEHGRCLARTIRAIGYPSRELLMQWVDELAPEMRKVRKGSVRFSYEQKTEAVLAFCSRNSAAQGVADDHGLSRTSLYKWKNELLVKEASANVSDGKDASHPHDKDALNREVKSLKEQIQKLQMERDILLGTIDIAKKDPGADPQNLTNQEKTKLIDALRQTYRLNDLLESLRLPKSSYFYHRIANSVDKYEELRAVIRRYFTENHECYGYRRIHSILAKDGVKLSEKVVRRIMKEEELVVHIKRRRKYNSYQGEITPAAENILERDFYADKPNTKWLTDITEFHIPAGKVYLSPIVDCFDGMLPSWTISTVPDANLVNSMLDLAIETLGDDDHPILHSDRGCHYRWPGWFSRMEAANLTRSMSRKGCTPDNAACEGLFGRIKNEMFYNRPWQGVSIEEFIDILDRYLHWYNNHRIKVSLGGMSPLEYRQRLGLIA